MFDLHPFFGPAPRRGRRVLPWGGGASGSRGDRPSVLATVNTGVFEATPLADVHPSAPEMPPAAPEHGSEAVVEVGDTVIVRFADDNRVRRFHLSQKVNNPDHGVVHVSQPIGEALLGNGLEEEIELIVGGQARKVVIEEITKTV